jgi:hypothetical protein
VPGAAHAAVPGTPAGAVRSRHVLATVRPAPAVVILGVIAAVIAASAAYEAALALGLTAYSARGEAPPGSGGLELAGLVAIWLAAAILMGAAAANARIGGWPVIAAVTALAAAAAVARYYAPEPYYLNTHDRIADHYPGTRVAALVVLAAAAAAIARIRPRAGAPIAAAVLVLCAVTLAGEGYNH